MREGCDHDAVIKTKNDAGPAGPGWSRAVLLLLRNRGLDFFVVQLEQLMPRTIGSALSEKPPLASHG